MDRPSAAILVPIFALLAIGFGAECRSVQAPDCANLVSAGVAPFGHTTKPAFLFINASDSACTLRAPMVSLIDYAGTRLNVPQDWAPMANEQVLHLDAQGAAAVAFMITSPACPLTLRASYMSADFGGGLNVRVSIVVELCPGSRIKIWAPVAAQMCPDGSFAWTPPEGGGLGCPPLVLITAPGGSG